MDKVKKELIYKAKTKKAYAKIRARELGAPLPAKSTPKSKPTTSSAPELADPEEPNLSSSDDEEEEEQETPLPPPPAPSSPPKPSEQQQEDEAQEGPEPNEHPDRFRNRKKPSYFDKQLKEAQRRRQAAQDREAAFERRRQDRERAVQERRRMRKLSMRARERGPDGRRKLGRESEFLLEKVKKMMGAT